jgi:uroporphyrinogen decarboxylase
MTPRGRILTALKHKEPDRVPFDLGSTGITGIHKIAYCNLLAYLGMEGKEIQTFDIIQQLAMVNEDLLQRFKVDTRGVLPKDPLSWSLKIQEEDKYRYFTDEYGIKWSMPKEGGLYYDMTHHPLSVSNLTVKYIEDYPWPDPQDPARIEGLKEEVEQLQKTDCAIVLNGPGAGLFERSLWMRGFERFYIDLVRDPPLAISLLDKLTDFRIELWELLLDEVGDLVQIVVEADDLATQRSLMISPEMYRRYIKPRHKRVFSFIKEKAPHVHIFFHSCGSIYDLIPDLIEVGVDILNPVQVNAAKMDTKQLKREFGDVLCFWGGGIDTQRVLPRGTPDEVRDEVKRRIDDLAPDGGFIFSTVHNIQADVPPENIIAMWEALQEHGRYK